MGYVQLLKLQHFAGNSSNLRRFSKAMNALVSTYKDYKAEYIFIRQAGAFTLSYRNQHDINSGDPGSSIS